MLFTPYKAHFVKQSLEKWKKHLDNKARITQIASLGLRQCVHTVEERWKVLAAAFVVPIVYDGGGGLEWPQ